MFQFQIRKKKHYTRLPTIPLLAATNHAVFRKLEAEGDRSSICCVNYKLREHPGS
jgi:hypothetical protein